MSRKHNPNRTTYYLGPELIKRIRRLAEATGRSESGFMRFFLTKQLPLEEEQAYGTSTGLPTTEPGEPDR